MTPPPTAEELTGGFLTLEAGVGSTGGVQSRPTAVLVAGGPVRQVADPRLGRGLLIPLTDGAPSGLPDSSAAVSLSRRTLVERGDQREYLEMRCADERLAGTFAHFCADLLTSLSPGLDPVTTVSRVIDLWRDLLVPRAAAHLSIAATAGLIAELHLLRAVVQAIGGPAALASWTAPDAGRHDFRSGTVAVEVKATTDHNRVRAAIHGLSQLVPPEGASLYLHAERLEVTGLSGDTVPSLLDDLVASGVGRRDLLARLTARGCDSGDRFYATTGMTTLETRTVLVDEHFPALTAAALRDEALGARIEDLRYTVDLTDTVSRALTSVELDELTSRMGDR